MKKNGRMRIELPLAIIDFIPEGLIHVHLKAHNFNLNETQKIFNHLSEFSPWETCPLLLSQDHATELNKESENFLNSEYICKKFSAIGLISHNFFQKTISSIFNLTHKHQTQKRFFTNEEDAFNWLSVFEKKRKSETIKRELSFAS